MKSVKIFGREPVMITTLIESVLALAIAFGWLQWIGLSTQDDMAAVVAVVAALLGVYVAYVTNETLLGVVTGLIKAVLVLAAVYGLQITADQTALLIAASGSVIALWQRGQVSPMDMPSFKNIAVDDTHTIPPTS